MQKQEAIELLGGSRAAAAEAIGISYQAVSKWPEILPDAIRDRVQAALYRNNQPAEDGTPSTHRSSAAIENAAQEGANA